MEHTFKFILGLSHFLKNIHGWCFLKRLFGEKYTF